MKSFAGFAAACLLAVPVLADEAPSAKLESGPKTGSDVAPFEVVDVTGKYKGTEVCYRCKLADAPVVAVFAREINDKVEKAAKQLDSDMTKNKELKAFFVFVTEDKEKAEKQLKEIAKKHELKTLPLTIFASAKGPDGYNISKDAGVTLVAWKEGTVKMTKAYKSGAFCDHCAKGAIASFVKENIKTEKAGG